MLNKKSYNTEIIKAISKTDVKKMFTDIPATRLIKQMKRTVKEPGVIGRTIKKKLKKK